MSIWAAVRTRFTVRIEADINQARNASERGELNELLARSLMHLPDAANFLARWEAHPTLHSRINEPCGLCTGTHGMKVPKSFYNEPVDIKNKRERKQREKDVAEPSGCPLLWGRLYE